MVRAVDKSGKVVVDTTTSSMANGFFELWLPRNHTINLTIKYQDKTARGVIETFGNSKTCITTLHLR